jgi:integrase
MAKVPKLRRHATGVYFCQFAGTRRYFSVNLEESEREYRQALREWTAWQDERERGRTKTTHRIIDIIREYLASRLTDASEDQWRWCRSHLGRLGRTWGALPADAFNARLLQALKADMMQVPVRSPSTPSTPSGPSTPKRKLAAKTINHDLRAIKSLFRWASDMGYCREVNLRAVKMLPLPQLQRKTATIADVHRVINLALGREIGHHPKTLERLTPNPSIAPWLAVNYLAALRPSEVVRLVHGEGVWIGKGLFQPKVSKTFKDGRHPRVYVLSDEALMWLQHARPTWSEMKNYGAAVRRAVGPGWPHPLRHSAAAHLSAAGVDRAEIERALGHYPRAVSQTYLPVELAPLRATLARLSLGPIAPG